MALVCWKCGASLADLPRPITRLSNCKACYAELHCCVACRHFTTRYNKKCDHDLADPPLRKDSANFCDYFKPLSDAFKAKQAGEAKAADANLRALFGGEDADSRPDPDDPRAKLDSLFKPGDDEESD